MKYRLRDKAHAALSEIEVAQVKKRIDAALEWLEGNNND